MWRVVLLGVMVWAAVASGQTEPETAGETIGGLGFIDEVQVTVVSVDVYVRDKKGRPVTGLKAEDFRVRQDGIEMPISNFAALDREVVEHYYTTLDLSEIVLPMPDRQEAPPEVEIQPVYMVLYVDNENLNPLHRNRVLRRVREFVSENLEGPVQMMVASYDRNLRMIQPFTNEPLDINSALKSLDKVSGGKTTRENERRRIVDTMQEIAVDDRAAKGADSRYGVQMRLRQQISAFAEEEALAVNYALDGLKETMAVLSGLEGRKSLIYISSGLPMSPGLGLMHEYATIFSDSAFLGQRSNTDRTRAFQSLTAAASSQEVSIYTIDASGLNPLEGYSAEDKYGATDPTASSIGSKNYQDSLRYMAQRTGGLAIINTNDVTGGLELIRDDLFTYYSLGYTISPSGHDRVHRIEVEIPGHTGYDLRYRRRHVEKSRETQVQDRVYSTLMVDVDDNPMDVEIVRLRPQPVAADRWQVPLHLSFHLSTIALIPEGDEYVGRVVLFLGARDMEGRSSEMQRQEHVVRVSPEQYEEAKSKRFGIEIQLLLREGQHRVSAGLMDLMTRQASYQRIVVTVP